MPFHPIILVYPFAHSLPWPLPSPKPGRTDCCLNWAAAVLHRNTYQHLKLFIIWVCLPKTGCNWRQMHLCYQHLPWSAAYRKTPTNSIDRIHLGRWHLSGCPSSYHMDILILSTFQGSSSWVYPLTFPWGQRHGGGQGPDPCLTSILLAFLMKVLEIPDI